MADTFSNDLRLRLQESGSNAGTWGDLLNGTITNIASGFGQGSEAIPNASTHTITLADGTADEARSLYLKCTGGGQACTVTLGPNTISKVWIIDNATSYTLTFSQGSGANVAIAAGAVKVIATDGAGSGAAVVDTLDGLEGSFSTLAVTGAITANGGIALGDNNKATFGAGDDLEIYHTSNNNHSIIEEVGGGNLVVRTNGPHIEFDKGSTEYMARMLVDGAVELYYDSALKLATTSTGIDVTGTATATKLVSTNGVLELDDNGSHNGVINVPASLFINIDSDNGATGEDFVIAKDRTGTSGGTELFRVQEDGSVGIGVSAPAYKIDATTTSGGNGIKMARGADSFFEQFQSATGGVQLAASGSGAFMAFRTGTTAGTTTEHLRISAAGGITGTMLEASNGEYVGSLDDLKKTGFYRSKNTNTNNPSFAYYSVVVYGNQGNVTAQMATLLAGPATYVRSFNTTWTSWVRIDD